MISRFVNIFKKTDLDEQRAFQRRVHAILSERYADRDFTLTDDPSTLNMGETVLGLTNLKANFLLSEQTEADLKELAAAQFDIVFQSTEYFDGMKFGWEEAQGRLMPQLMPADFVTKMDLIHFPFGDEVLIGFVLDSDEAYGYLRNESIADWEVDKNEIKSRAISNLGERSKGIEMTVVPADNGIFAVNTMDGFDAVRIIDPALQQVISEYIGTPFCLGVPNRDFLICWSKNDDTEFQNQMRLQVSSDFAERPYPLSGRTFEVNCGSIVLAETPEPDPRSFTAESN
jgi:uncharacterized protein YtpQ (UPF0354 family)